MQIQTSAVWVEAIVGKEEDVASVVDGFRYLVDFLACIEKRDSRIFLWSIDSALYSDSLVSYQAEIVDLALKLSRKT